MHRLSDPSALPRFILVEDPLPPPGPVRLVAAHPLRRRRAPPLHDPVGAVPATRLDVAARAIRERLPGRPGQPVRRTPPVVAVVALAVHGAGARAAQPPDVVDPRGWGPPLQVRFPGRGSITTSPGTQARRLVGPGLRRADHRCHVPLGADQPWPWASTPTSAPPPRSSRNGAARPAPGVHHRLRVSWVEVETGAERHAGCSWPETDLALAEPSWARGRPGKGGWSASLHPAIAALLSHGESWPPAPTSARAHRRTRRVRRLDRRGHPGRRHRRPGRRHHPAGAQAGSTSCSSSCRCGPPRRPGRWWRWPGWP